MFALPQLFLMITYELADITNSSSVKGYLVQNLINPITIIVFVPFLNNMLFPLLGNYMPNMRKRIAIGIVLIIVAAALRALTEMVNKTAGAAWSHHSANYTPQHC